MPSCQTGQEEKLMSQDIEQAEGFAHSEGEQWQRGRMLRNGLISSVLVGFFVLAVLHVSGSKALHSSLSGVQVKTGMYNSAQAPVFASAPAAFAPAPASAATSAAEPAEDMDDGNTCEDDEELWGKLCYKKCTLLTSGQHPVRVSSYGCAKSKSFTDLLTGESVPSLIPCHGYDISGDEAGNGCPHDEGACLEDEEISLGKCYKKCSLLTDGVYPYRTSAMSCCKSSALAQCLTPSSVKMSNDYAVGGGSNSRESRVHNPEVKYTESTGVPAPAISAPAPPPAPVQYR